MNRFKHKKKNSANFTLSSPKDIWTGLYFKRRNFFLILKKRKKRWTSLVRKTDNLLFLDLQKEVKV